MERASSTGSPPPLVRTLTPSNRVLKDFKESDPNQVAWAKSFVQVLEDLYEYVKSVHTTGVAWNPRGGEASGSTVPSTLTLAPAAAAASAAPAGPPPAPVAPPPLIIDESAPAAEAAAPEAAARAGLFAALNQVCSSVACCFLQCTHTRLVTAVSSSRRSRSLK